MHNVLAFILVINAALSLFWHLASGEIRQFIPRPYGFFDNAIVQAKYYLQGIFNSPPPREDWLLLNLLQQVTTSSVYRVARCRSLPERYGACNNRPGRSVWDCRFGAVP
jgi:hypothetical protein